jgi:hypothetical protein
VQRNDQRGVDLVSYLGLAVRAWIFFQIKPANAIMIIFFMLNLHRLISHRNQPYYEAIDGNVR